MRLNEASVENFLTIIRHTPGMFESIMSGLKWLSDAVGNARVTAGLAAFFGVFWLFGGGPLDELGLPPAAHTLTGVACLASLAALATQAVPRLWNTARSAWAERRRRAEVIKYLDTLSPDEREVIVGCVRDNQQSALLAIHMGVGPSLEAKGILIRAGMGHSMGYPYIIPAFVWDYLQRNKEVVLELWDH